MIYHWAYSDHYNTALFVPFESLIDAVEGPIVMEKVSGVLVSAKVPLMTNTNIQQSTTATTLTISSESTLIGCLWNETVQNTHSMKRSDHKYQPSYTEVQRQAMMKLMDEMMASDLTQDRPELMPILQGYRSYMEHKLRIDELD